MFTLRCLPWGRRAPAGAVAVAITFTINNPKSKWQLLHTKIVTPKCRALTGYIEDINYCAATNVLPEEMFSLKRGKQLAAVTIIRNQNDIYYTLPIKIVTLKCRALTGYIEDINYCAATSSYYILYFNRWATVRKAIQYLFSKFLSVVQQQRALAHSMLSPSIKFTQSPRVCISLGEITIILFNYCLLCVNPLTNSIITH